MSGFKAKVRFLLDRTVRNVEPGSTHTYRRGEVVEMWRFSSRPRSWWSSVDIDGAYIVGDGDVELIEWLKDC